MSKTAYGIQSVQKGGIDAVTGLPTGLADVGDLLQGTITMEETEGNITNFFSELKKNPVLSITEAGEKTFRFQLMDTRADTLVQYLGGTVVESPGNPDVWNEPEDHPDIEASFEIVTEDGQKFTIHRGKVMARLVGNFARTGITVIDVRVVPLEPLVDGVRALTIGDNFNS